MNAVAGVAITLGKALQPEYADYCRRVLDNAQVLAKTLIANGSELVTGGTENHMMVVDTVKSFGINGRVAEETLDLISITTNKQVIPDDPNPPLRHSGIRLGTPAATTRGMVGEDMKQLGVWISEALKRYDDQSVLEAMKIEVEDLCGRFPVPGISD